MKKKKPYIVLLRGVMPTGKNRIPKMSFLQEILSTEFDSVRTYIQSWNIVLISDRSRSEIAKKVFELIKKHIGPELSSIVVTREESQEILDKNPFWADYNISRVFFTLTNNNYLEKKLKIVATTRNFNTLTKLVEMVEKLH